MIAEHLAQIEANITQAAQASGRTRADITLLAATKTRSCAEIQEAISLGITHCGENRVQELTPKLDENAYRGAQVHFIGRLQKNKVKYLVGRVDCIESVDSPALLDAIALRAAQMELTQRILLQVNIGNEPQKGGVSPESLPYLIDLCNEKSSIELSGLMCIPPIGQETAAAEKSFLQMHHLFVDITTKMVNNKSSISTLSMGMSGDYVTAIACGATQVRLGTVLFGARHI